jgi:preprotein translocase subunit SecD
MVFYYRVFGMFSVLALAINGFFLIALLSMLQATLTLPGMAASRSRSAWRSTPTC